MSWPRRAPDGGTGPGYTTGVGPEEAAGVRLARRVRDLPGSGTAALFERVRALRERGEAVLDLGVGEPDIEPPPAVAAAVREVMARGAVRYTGAAGAAVLREAVARRAARAAPGLDAGNVVVTVGAKQALALACLALLEAGDEALIPHPAWPSFAAMVRLAGAVPVPVPTLPERGWRPDPAAVAAAWTARTRLLVLASPHNPTGATLAQHEVDALVEVALARGGAVLSDETYAAFFWGGEPPGSALPWVALAPGRVAVASSVSKAFGMTGWRVGWLLAAEPLVSAVARLAAHTTTCAPAAGQLAAAAALADAGRWEAAARERLRPRREALVAALEELPGVRLIPPAGALYAFPLLDPPPAGGTEALARRLLEDHRVAVVPGEAFGAPGALRISFAVPEGVLGAALPRLVSALATSP